MLHADIWPSVRDVNYVMFSGAAIKFENVFLAAYNGKSKPQALMQMLSFLCQYLKIYAGKKSWMTVMYSRTNSPLEKGTATGSRLGRL